METAKNLVDTINLLNKYAPQVITQVKNQLDRFIGKPIFKADGSWRKVVDWNHPEIKVYGNGKSVSVMSWLKQEYGYVRLYIKICHNGGKYEDNTYFCIYQEASIDLYTADENGNIGLLDLDLTRFDVRYDLAEMQKQADKAKALAKKFEAEADKVPWQFRDVLDVPRLR